MLTLPNRKKDRIYIYNKKKYLKRYFFLFIKVYLVIIFFIYITEANFFTVYKIKENSMEPELKKNSWIISRKISQRKIKQNLDNQSYLSRGQVIALNYMKSSSTWKKVLDFPVFMLSFGFVKLDKDAIIVRRILGLPNERIKIVNKDIFIDEEKYTPNWLILFEDFRVLENNVLPRDNFPEIFIPPTKVFVINDRWDSLSDSRTLGLIDIEDLEGFYSRTILE